MFQIKIYINRLKVRFKNEIIPTFLVDSLTDLFIFILIHLLTDEREWKGFLGWTESVSISY